MKDDIHMHDWQIKNDFLFMGDKSIFIKQIDSFSFTSPFYSKVINFLCTLIFLVIICYGDLFIKNMEKGIALYLIFWIMFNLWIHWLFHEVIIIANGKEYRHVFLGGKKDIGLEFLSRELTKRRNK